MPAGDHFKPDYVAVNPKSTIPALMRKDGSTLTEVPAIAYWLARTHGRAKLWPETPEDEARALEIMAYVVDTVHGQGFARIFATKTFARNPDEHQAVRQLGRDIIEKGFAILNDAIAGKTYVAGISQSPIQSSFTSSSGLTRPTFRCQKTLRRITVACWHARRCGACCGRKAIISRPWAIRDSS